MLYFPIEGALKGSKVSVQFTYHSGRYLFALEQLLLLCIHSCSNLSLHKDCQRLLSDHWPLTPTYVARYYIHNTYYTSLLHKSECDMARYLTSRCPYWNELQVSENTAWEWDISPFTIWTSVINYLFYANTLTLLPKLKKRFFLNSHLLTFAPRAGMRIRVLSGIIMGSRSP